MRRPVDSPLSLFAFQDIITATTGILILITLILCFSIREQRTPEHVPDVDRDIQAARLESLQSEVEILRSESAQLEQRTRLLVGLSAAQLEQLLEATRAANDRTVGMLEKTETERRTLAQDLRSRSVEQAELSANSRKLAELEQKARHRQTELDQINSSNRLVYNFRSSGSQVPWIVEVDGDRLIVARAGVKQPPRVFDDPSITRRLGDFESWVNSLDRDDRYFVTLVKPAGVSIYAAMGGPRGLRPVLEQAGASVGVDLISPDQTVMDPHTGASF